MEIPKFPIEIEMEGIVFTAMGLRKVSGRRWIAQAYTIHPVLGRQEVVSPSVLYRLAEQILNSATSN